MGELRNIQSQQQFTSELRTKETQAVRTANKIPLAIETQPRVIHVGMATPATQVEWFTWEPRTQL